MEIMIIEWNNLRKLLKTKITYNNIPKYFKKLNKYILSCIIFYLYYVN